MVVATITSGKGYAENASIDQFERRQGFLERSKSFTSHELQHASGNVHD